MSKPLESVLLSREISSSDKPMIAVGESPLSAPAAPTTASTLAPHPDASAPQTPDTSVPNSEPNCIVRCFISIKNQIVRFFEWLCSLCGSKQLTEEEKEIIKMEEKLAEGEAEFEKLSKNAPPEMRISYKLGIELSKALLDVRKLYGITTSRYKNTIKEEDAMVYLYDLCQMQGSLLLLREAIKNARGIETTLISLNISESAIQNVNSIISTIQRATKQINDHFKTHKSLTVPNQTEQAKVIEMVKQLKDDGPLFLMHLLAEKQHPVYTHLLSFINKLRKQQDSTLPEITKPKKIDDYTDSPATPETGTETPIDLRLDAAATDSDAPPIYF